MADRLSAEVGYTGQVEPPGAHTKLGKAMGEFLNSEDEQLVALLRRSLARIAAAAAPDDGGTTGTAVGAALDGAEMVIRGELLRGNAEQLPALLPSFVYLVVLPVAKQGRALELSRRAKVLIDGALGD